MWRTQDGGGVVYAAHRERVIILGVHLRHEPGCDESGLGVRSFEMDG